MTIPAQEPKGPLPFSTWLPLIAGGVYGLVLRLLFSGMIIGGEQMPTVMAAAFVYAVPFAVGAITIYLAERVTRRSWVFYVFVPWLAVALFVGGTAVALIEGLICIAMALPLFCLLGSAGGLLMGLICRLRKRPVRTLQSIALLPLLMAAGEHLIPSRNDIDQVQRSVHIAAAPADVWKLILNPRDMRPEELQGGLAYRIGVPYPVQAITERAEVGAVRKSFWQKGVQFDERISAIEPERFIAWTYQFTPESFPAGSMDEHVVIGGQYFDLLDTRYTLTPENGGTRLDLDVRFRATTKFNWYAVPLANYMLNDTAGVLLNFYRQRAEHVATRR
ncbi:SRPBCC family protein [Pseudomonas sp. LRF_L74]|uniref:SRPBCC family protein n=1 Tax=Pseudomonas sp. LRF_L74 TaxID=3369422 RepID=UPI003F5E1006